MTQKLRQYRRLPLPDTPTLTLTLDDGRTLVLDRRAEMPLKTPGNSPSCSYMGHGFLVVISRSIHPQHGQLLHASISHVSGQLPQWYLLKALKRAIFPDNVAAMIPIPEDQSYVNIAEALHIIQTPGPWGNL